MSTRIKPSPLSEFERQEYADWLWRGLRSFYSLPARERVRAFDYVGVSVSRQESLCEGLAHVYETYVPDARKLSFRQAIGDVLRDQSDNENAPLAACQDLIYLLVRTRATESLGSLLPAVGNGLPGRRRPSLLFDAVAALRSLAPSTYAYQTAREIVSAANFDDGYLFEAIKVLVECEPSRIAVLLRELEPRLSDLRRQAEGLRAGNEDEWTAFSEAANELARHLFAVGPRSWLQEVCHEVPHMEEPGWLLACLLENVPSKDGLKDSDAVWMLRAAQDSLAQDAARDLVSATGMEALRRNVNVLLKRPYARARATGPAGA